MKKILFTAAFLFVGIASVQAQDIARNALGLRFGGGDGFGTEISYQRGLGGNNRLELDLGIETNDAFDAFQLAAIYHWVWNIDGGLNWYAGPGGGVAFIDFDDDIRGFRDDDSETALFVGGQIGLEYDFDIPLQISLDVRPAFYFGDFRDDSDYTVGLGVRYQF